MKRFFFIALLLFLLSVSSFAQNPSATPPVEADEDIKISTSLIQIDVTVTDKKGNVVKDLKPEDFEVYENGKKQDITNFSFISVNPQTREQEIVKQQKPVKGQISIPLPPVRLKQEQVRRTYALVVDDLGLSFENIRYVQQSLKKFINEQMQEGDLVAIIRTGSGIGALQSFTSDKRLLLAAVDKLKWNPQGRVGISTFSAIEPSAKEDIAKFKGSSGRTETNSQGDGDDKDFSRQLEEFRNENFSVGTLGALNYIIRGMRDLPGRKAIMLFSEGFVLSSNAKFRAPNRILDGLRVLADLANRSSVVIYTLDPRGLQIPGMANANDVIAEVLPDGFDVGSYEDERMQREQDFNDSQASLRYLAYQTGGLPFINQNDINKGLRDVIADQSSYYLVGYQPDAETFDPKKNKFNKLEVRLKRTDLKIRYRSGFFGITDEKIRNTAQMSPQQKTLSALTSPFSASEVNLSLYPIYGNDAQGGDFIRALVYIDANDLKFTEAAADGKRKASFDIIAMTFGDNGVAIDRLSKNFTLEVGESDYQNVLKKGVVYDLPLPVKKAGAYQFRIALRDAASDKVGSASQFVEVPNLKKNKLTLSNLILDAFSPDEWKKIKLGQAQTVDERGIFRDTALRRFGRGSVLKYNYVVYNFKTDRTQSAQFQTQTRLIRDGKVVFEGSRTPLRTQGQTDLQRLQASGAITLGSNLEAGSYILQIIVFDLSDARKERFTTQVAEFEITE